MDDFKEDLLDTAVVLKKKLQNFGIGGLLLIIGCFALWPVLYLGLTFGIIKLIVSGIGTSYIAFNGYKKFN